jgi:hypothetical protein
MPARHCATIWACRYRGPPSGMQRVGHWGRRRPTFPQFLLTSREFPPLQKPASSDRVRPTRGTDWGGVSSARQSRACTTHAATGMCDVVFRFARDSPLEGGGFEPSVPRKRRSGLPAGCTVSITSFGRRAPRRAWCCATRTKPIGRQRRAASGAPWSEG